MTDEPAFGEYPRHGNYAVRWVETTPFDDRQKAREYIMTILGDGPIGVPCYLLLGSQVIEAYARWDDGAVYSYNWDRPHNTMIRARVYYKRNAETYQHEVDIGEFKTYDGELPDFEPRASEPNYSVDSGVVHEWLKTLALSCKSYRDLRDLMTESTLGELTTLVKKNRITTLDDFIPFIDGLFFPSPEDNDEITADSIKGSLHSVPGMYRRLA